MAQNESALPYKIDSDSLVALPRTSGVYIFRGEGKLTLYIGKSVDIRSRGDTYKILVKSIMLGMAMVELV
ncbi:hypothetical protein [Limnohabitans sp.]